MEKLFFLFFAVITIGSAACVVFSKNVAHSAFSLVLTLFAVACLYIMLKAEFLAAAQIIVYAGAVMVLFIFTLMLININDVIVIRRFHKQTVAVIALVCVMVLEAIIFTIPQSTFSSIAGKLAEENQIYGGNTGVIGHHLLTNYLFPFEFTSAVILVAVIAAVFIGKTTSKPREGQES